MPNLTQIQFYHKRYKPDSEIARSKAIASVLKESINPDRLEKAFLNLPDKLGLNFDLYLEYGLEAEVALLYIDICSFSSRYAQLSAKDLSTFLDKYYEKIIPIVYEYGGEIDRIMGDGIVAVFGLPFLDAKLELTMIKALGCALKAICITSQTEFYSKIALHAGRVRYYRNKSAQYPEYTIIGKPITELYRLESIADDDSIAYYTGSWVDNLIEQLKSKDKLPIYGHPKWEFHGDQYISSILKGVDFNYIKQIHHL